MSQVNNTPTLLVIKGFLPKRNKILAFALVKVTGNVYWGTLSLSTEQKQKKNQLTPRIS